MGDEAGMFNVLRGYGLLAYRRGDSEEAGEYFSRALANAERRNDRQGVAVMYDYLGLTAHLRGNYAEAMRLHQRSLKFGKRLGIPPEASRYTHLGVLSAQEGRPPGEVIGWHVKALKIRLVKRLPGTEYDLRRLAACQVDLGEEKFGRLLAKAAGKPQLAREIKSLIDTIGDAGQEATADSS
jgi:tetratricopeptide (TPR) repeat protein